MTIVWDSPWHPIATAPLYDAVNVRSGAQQCLAVLTDDGWREAYYSDAVVDFIASEDEIGFSPTEWSQLMLAPRK